MFSEKVQQQVALAKERVSKQDFTEAVATYDGLIRMIQIEKLKGNEETKNPEQLCEAFSGKATVLTIQKKPLDAISCLEEAATLATDAKKKAVYEAKAHNLRGSLHYGVCQPQEALVEYSKAIKLWNHVAFLESRGHVYSYLEDFDNAIKDMQEAIKLNTKRGHKDKTFHPLVSLANIYVKMGKFQSSTEKFKEARAVAVGDAQLSFLQAFELHAEAMQLLAKSTNENENDKDTALDLLCRAIALEGFTSDFYLQRGLLEFASRDVDKACQDFTKAIEFSEERNGEAFLGRGRFHRLRNNLRLAFRDLTTAEKLLTLRSGVPRFQALIKQCRSELNDLFPREPGDTKSADGSEAKSKPNNEKFIEFMKDNCVTEKQFSTHFQQDRVITKGDVITVLEGLYHGRRVVVKQLSPDTATSSHFSAFYNEAYVLASLAGSVATNDGSGSGLVRLRAMVTDRNQQNELRITRNIFDYVDGSVLTTYLSPAGTQKDAYSKISSEQRCKWITQLANMMKQLHAGTDASSGGGGASDKTSGSSATTAPGIPWKSLVFAGFESESVMVRAKDKALFLVHFNRARPSSVLYFPATPETRYTAPELVSNNAGLPTVYSDVYAFAILAIEILSGSEWELSKSAKSSLLGKTAADIPFPAFESNAGNDAVKALVTECLTAVNPDRRPSATAIFDRLST